MDDLQKLAQLNGPWFCSMAGMEETAGCPGCQRSQARIAELEGMVRDLTAQVKDLMAKLQGNRPPSRPAAKMPSAPAKKPTGRKPGGQPGHPPHLKRRLPPEFVSNTVAHIPKTCEHCQAALPQVAGATDPEPTWHQVVELPPVLVTVTEHQGHARTCLCCGQVTRAAIPAEVLAHCIGPRLTGVIGYLTGDQGMSKRGVEELVEHVFGVPLGLGTVSNLEQEMSAALAAAHTEATDAVRDALVKNVDETGWKENGKKRWLWLAATKLVAVFIVHPWRNVTALEALLGREFKGILCSDRWVVYNQWPDPSARQLCWAHLKRNWEKMVERGGAAKRIGDRFLAIHKRVFESWHLFRGGGCPRTELLDQIAPLIEKMDDVIAAGRRCRDAKTQRFCARLEKQTSGLWTFAEFEGVEPTNNHGERVLRRAVLWRRRSFGCHSGAGCRFAERILTVATTLRLQRRNVVKFLGESIAAYRIGRPTPKLLPPG
jgi:transposase